MGKARYFFSLSGVILLIGALAISGKGINFGIDFDGGTRITAALSKPAGVEEVRNALTPLGLSDAKIQTLQNKDLGNNVVQISTKQLGPDGVDRAVEKLRDTFGIQGQTEQES